MTQSVTPVLARRHRHRPRCSDTALADYRGIPWNTVQNDRDPKQGESVWIVRPGHGLPLIGHGITQPEGFRDCPMITDEAALRE